MSPGTAGRDRDVDRWEIAAQTGRAPTVVDLTPDSNLQRVDDGGVGEWRSVGERPCFRLEAARGDISLPAGWYELTGHLASSEVADPCLLASHGGSKDKDDRIRLPQPDASGSIHGLVLFKYDVTALKFCPGGGLARFQMGRFRLHRASRSWALSHMLARASGSRGGSIVRGFTFLVDVLRQGISKAADALMTDYQRQVLPAQAAEYETWAARYDTLTATQMDELRARLTDAADAPLISILLPVYQTPDRWLRKCIDSVIAQVYPAWELCIVDDASPDSRVMATLEEYARRDDRIRIMRRSVNGHISAASNSALELARGDYVALLDHDDQLRPHALFEVAQAIMRSPGLALVYSDEDKLDASGCRMDPYFKPGWDPDLLRGQNYVCHFTTLRTDLVRSVGGFREGFEGSQDHDLILRCTEKLNPDQVEHIPKVLYHWRAIPGSTALSRDAKDYASSAGARAVDDHLRRMHPGARVEELTHGHFRVHWPLPATPPKVSLIVPTRDRVELLRGCVESILAKTSYPDFEIVVVDNRSSEPEALEYLAELESRERVRVLRYDAPFNYSAINNWAVRHCDGQVLGLINNDIEVISPDWLDEMASQALRPEVGAVGAMLYYPDDTIQHAGVILGIHGVAAHLYSGQPRGYPGHGGRARVAQEMSAVTGACLLVRRQSYEEVGGLSEDLEIAFNDIDFCLRLRAAGYRNVWTPFAELYHHESASRGLEDTEEKKQRFMREVEFMRERWGEQLLQDPAYNVNLSLTSLNSEVSAPPRRWA